VALEAVALPVELAVRKADAEAAAVALEEPVELAVREAGAEAVAADVAVGRPVELPDGEPVELAVDKADADAEAVAEAVAEALVVSVELESLRPRRTGAFAVPPSAWRRRRGRPAASAGCSSLAAPPGFLLQFAAESFSTSARALQDASSASAKLRCRSAPAGSAGSPVGPRSPAGYATSASIAA